MEKMRLMADFRASNKSGQSLLTSLKQTTWAHSIQIDGKTRSLLTALRSGFDEMAILLATESAAEGIDLQFCSLVINYDLPWNPQRIEQRIGRCLRTARRERRGRQRR